MPSNSAVLSINAFIYIVCIMLFSATPVFNKLIYLSGISFCFYYFLCKKIIFTSRTWILHTTPFIFLLFISGMRNISDTFVMQQVFLLWIPMLTLMCAIESKVDKLVVFYALLFSSFINGLIVSLGLDAAYSAAVNQPTLDLDSISRATGTTGNANVYALQALLPLLVLPSISERITLKYKVLAHILCIQAALLSQSRKAAVILLAYYIILFFQFGIKYKGNLHLYKILFLFFCILIIATFFFYDYDINSILIDSPLLQRFSEISDGESSFSERVDFISKGLELFIQSPIFGHGLDTFKTLSGSGVYSHNNYIEVGTSGGITLLISYYGIHLLHTGKVLFSNMTNENKAIFAFTITSILFLDSAMVSIYSAPNVLLLLMLISKKILITHKNTNYK